MIQPNRADGAFILECSNTNQEKGVYSYHGRHRHNVIRPLAPFAVHELFVNRCIPSTVVNYTDFWDSQTLADSLYKWASTNNVTKPLILCSTLFNANLLAAGMPIHDTIIKLREYFPDAPLILGGPIGYHDYKVDSLVPDAVFHGRSLHLFEQLLDGHTLDSGVHRKIGSVDYFHHRTNDIVEEPIVPRLFDDYCLDEHDILMFETRLGCKFNCTFCTFEFRGATKTTDATVIQLRDFFQQAHDRYGVKHFSVADDTFNEDDTKIARLEAATAELTFRPTIVGYNRFDIMMAKPEQCERLDNCGFVGHYFGIETLHREASKVIRKGVRKERAYDFMRYMRDQFPHWWTCTGYIVGVPREPKEHIMEVFRTLCGEKLMKSIIPVDLGLYGSPGFENDWSDFVRDPEKFGLEIICKDNPGDWHWRHECMDKNESVLYAKRLAAYVSKRDLSILCPWEWVSVEAMGAYGIEAADAQINRYIQRKTAQLTGS
jgi:lipoate synthase